MRTTLWCLILSAALATGACKKKQDDTGAGSAERDLSKTKDDLSAVKSDLKGDLAAARDKYATTVKDRLAKLDARIHDLEQRTDAKSKEALDKLRARRAELATNIDTMKDHAATDWDAFTKRVDSTFDGIEQDVGDALK